MHTCLTIASGCTLAACTVAVVVDGGNGSAIIPDAPSNDTECPSMLQRFQVREHAKSHVAALVQGEEQSLFKMMSQVLQKVDGLEQTRESLEHELKRVEDSNEQLRQELLGRQSHAKPGRGSLPMRRHRTGTDRDRLVGKTDRPPTTMLQWEAHEKFEKCPSLIRHVPASLSLPEQRSVSQEITGCGSAGIPLIAPSSSAPFFQKACCDSNLPHCSGCAVQNDAGDACITCQGGFIKDEQFGCVPCLDLPGWPGNSSTCQQLTCTDSPVNGVSSNDACCACGGGQRTATPFAYVTNPLLLGSRSRRVFGRPFPRTASSYALDSSCELTRFGLTVNGTTGALQLADGCDRVGCGQLEPFSIQCTITAQQEVGPLQRTSTSALLTVVADFAGYEPLLVVTNQRLQDLPLFSRRRPPRPLPQLSLTCAPVLPWLFVRRSGDLRARNVRASGSVTGLASNLEGSIGGVCRVSGTVGVDPIDTQVVVIAPQPWSSLSYSFGVGTLFVATVGETSATLMPEGRSSTSQMSPTRFSAFCFRQAHGREDSFVFDIFTGKGTWNGHQIIQLNVASGAFQLMPATSLAGMFGARAVRAVLTLRCLIYGHHEWTARAMGPILTHELDVELRDDTCWSLRVLSFAERKVVGNMKLGKCRQLCRTNSQCLHIGNEETCIFYTSLCARPDDVACLFRDVQVQARIPGCGERSSCIDLRIPGRKDLSGDYCPQGEDAGVERALPLPFYLKVGTTIRETIYLRRYQESVGPFPFCNESLGDWVLRRADPGRDFINASASIAELRGEVLGCLRSFSLAPRGLLSAIFTSLDVEVSFATSGGSVISNVSAQVGVPSCGRPNITSATDEPQGIEASQQPPTQVDSVEIFVIDDPSTGVKEDYWLHPCHCFPESWGTNPPVNSMSLAAVPTANMFRPDSIEITTGGLVCPGSFDDEYFDLSQTDAEEIADCDRRCRNSPTCNFFWSGTVESSRQCRLHRNCTALYHEPGAEGTLYGIPPRDVCRIADPAVCWAVTKRRAFLRGGPNFEYFPGQGSNETPKCLYEKLLTMCDYRLILGDQSINSCARCTYLEGVPPDSLSKSRLGESFGHGQKLTVSCWDERYRSNTGASEELTCTAGVFLNSLGGQGLQDFSCIACVQVVSGRYAALQLTDMQEVFFTDVLPLTIILDSLTPKYLNGNASLISTEFSCANESQSCNCTGIVYFGRRLFGGALTTLEQLRESNFLSAAVFGSITCSSDAFGFDPLVGIEKHCICVQQLTELLPTRFVARFPEGGARNVRQFHTGVNMSCLAADEARGIITNPCQEFRKQLIPVSELALHLASNVVTARLPAPASSGLMDVRDGWRTVRNFRLEQFCQDFALQGFAFNDGLGRPGMSATCTFATIVKVSPENSTNRPLFAGDDRVRSVFNGQCLSSISNISNPNGDPITRLRACDSSDRQLWSIVADPTLTFRILALLVRDGAGGALDVGNFVLFSDQPGVDFRLRNLPNLESCLGIGNNGELQLEDCQPGEPRQTFSSGHGLRSLARQPVYCPSDAVINSLRKNGSNFFWRCGRVKGIGACQEMFSVQVPASETTLDSVIPLSVNCSTNQALQSFLAEVSDGGDWIRFRYTCCQLSGVPTALLPQPKERITDGLPQPDWEGVYCPRSTNSTRGMPRSQFELVWSFSNGSNATSAYNLSYVEAAGQWCLSNASFMDCAVSSAAHPLDENVSSSLWNAVPVSNFEGDFQVQGVRAQTLSPSISLPPLQRPPIFRATEPEQVPECRDEVTPGSDDFDFQRMVEVSNALGEENPCQGVGTYEWQPAGSDETTRGVTYQAVSDCNDRYYARELAAARTLRDFNAGSFAINAAAGLARSACGLIPGKVVAPFGKGVEISVAGACNGVVNVLATAGLAGSQGDRITRQWNNAQTRFDDCKPIQAGFIRTFCDLRCIRDAISSGNSAILDTLGRAVNEINQNTFSLLEQFQQNFEGSLNSLSNLQVQSNVGEIQATINSSFLEMQAMASGSFDDADYAALQRAVDNSASRLEGIHSQRSDASANLTLHLAKVVSEVNDLHRTVSVVSTRRLSASDGLRLRVGKAVEEFNKASELQSHMLGIYSDVSHRSKQRQSSILVRWKNHEMSSIMQELQTQTVMSFLTDLDRIWWELRSNLDDYLEASESQVHAFKEAVALMEQYSSKCTASFKDLRAGQLKSTLADRRAHEVLRKVWAKSVPLLGLLASKFADNGVLDYLLRADIQGMDANDLPLADLREACSTNQSTKSLTRIPIIQRAFEASVSDGLFSQTLEQTRIAFLELTMLYNRHLDGGLGAPENLATIQEAAERADASAVAAESLRYSLLEELIDDWRHQHC